MEFKSKSVELGLEPVEFASLFACFLFFRILYSVPQKNAEIVNARILTRHAGYNSAGDELLLRTFDLACKKVSVAFEWLFSAIRHKTASAEQKNEYCFRDLLIQTYKKD